VKSCLAVVGNKSIDVIIPTIGRKQYLYAVLQDLAQQTHLPVNYCGTKPAKIAFQTWIFLNQTWPLI
jgi:hypothetical protein